MVLLERRVNGSILVNYRQMTRIIFRQRRNENVEIFAEGLLNLAMQAYSSGKLLLMPIQNQIIEIFIYGLISPDLQLELFRVNSVCIKRP